MLLTKASPDEEFNIEVLQHWVKSLQGVTTLLERLQSSQEVTIELMEQLLTVREQMNKDLEARLASYETNLLPNSLTEPYRSN